MFLDVQNRLLTITYNWQCSLIKKYKLEIKNIFQVKSKRLKNMW